WGKARAFEIKPTLVLPVCTEVDVVQKLVIEAGAASHHVIGEVGHGHIGGGAGWRVGLEWLREIKDAATIHNLGIGEETTVGTKVARANLVCLLVLAGAAGTGVCDEGELASGAK